MMYGPFDKQLELRNIASGAKTATAAETGIAFPVSMAGDFKAVVYVSNADGGGSPANTYLLTIETDSEAAFGDDPVEVGRVSVAGNGVYEIPLSSWEITQRDPDASAIRVKATLSGSAPSLTYGCYLTPVM
jgi:hypothetical protein